MQQILMERRDEIVALCRAHHVRRLSVFGSAARDDFDPERSDFDFSYEMESADYGFRELFELEESLVRLLGRPVDLVRIANVENPFRRRSMLADETPLYAS